MAEAKHTPGPWHLGSLPPPGWRYITDSDGDVIAAVAEWCEDGTLHMEFKNAKSNARLIAAAPELLASLQEMASFTVGKVKTIPCGVTTRMMAAIAKACGGAP